MDPFEAMRRHDNPLLHDIKRVLDAAQDFVDASVRESGDKLTDARKQFESTLKDARRKLDDTESMVMAKAKLAAASTDEFVHSHPWKSIGLGAAVGLVVGMLIGRR